MAEIMPHAKKGPSTYLAETEWSARLMNNADYKRLSELWVAIENRHQGNATNASLTTMERERSVFLLAGIREAMAVLDAHHKANLDLLKAETAQEDPLTAKKKGPVL